MSRELIDVVYFYEHVARELDVACCVKALVEHRHGLRVEILQWPHDFVAASARLAPAVVALPFCYDETSFVPCLVAWPRARYFNLSWEQLFYAGNRVAKSPRGDFATRYVVHHAWSDAYAGFLRQAGIDGHRIVVNGNPAHMLYKAPYRAYFQDRSALASRHGLDPRKHWMFFPENYNWSFYSDETLETFVRKGQARTAVLEMREYCRQSLAVVLEWCAAAAGACEELEIIVRPRPSTPLQQFRSACAAIVPDLPARVHIINEGTVREWNLASDVVVSSHSTTLIEAALAGRPVYMLEPLPMPSALRVEWHRLVPKIETFAELLAVVNTPVGDVPSALREWAEATMLAYGDSLVGLADHLAMLARMDSPPALPHAVVTPTRRGLVGSVRLRYAAERVRLLAQSLKWRLVRAADRLGVRPLTPPFGEVVGRAAIETAVLRWASLVSGAGK